VARSIWSGVISFGLVSVPVRLYSATQEHEVSFHQFEKGTSDRIRYRRVNERTGKEVEYDDIVKGADVGGGEYVMLDPDELDAIAPGRSRSLEVHAFVALDEIDPVYYQKTYYLAPGSDETAKTYALLRDAMEDANRAAIGTLVMRNKEYLATIRPRDGLLVLETMYFADEVRDPHEELDDLPGKVKVRPQELAMAGQLIDSMSAPWKPEEYRDTYTDRVKELIDAKKEGAEVTLAEQAPEATNVTDLMEVLRRSVEAAKSSRGGGRRSGGASKSGGSARSRGGTGSGRAARSGGAAKKAGGRTATGAKKAAPAKKKTTAAKKTTSAAKKGTSAAKKGTSAAKKGTSAAKKAGGAKKASAAKKGTKKAA
jgi:DNA end-binding protein Ku